MNYEEFLNAVVESVRILAGKETEVLIHNVTKNNGVLLDGLVIMEKGKRFSPTVYLNEFYTEFLCGDSIDKIAKKVYGIYLKNTDNIKLPENFFTDFENLKGKIAYKLIHFGRNEELLKKIPHRRWKDLAIVYFVVYDNCLEERAVITIYNNHMELWHTSEEELYHLACGNTPKLYKPDIKPMNEVVSDMILKESDQEEDIDELICQVNKMNEAFPMYVLTNHMKNNGAICMLYEGLMEKFTRHIEADVFILPSSIHEVILVPVDGSISKDSLTEMVCSVNSQEVAQEELLSDCVYMYMRDKGFQ